MKKLSLVAAVALTLLKVSSAQAENNLTITTGVNTNVTGGPAFTTTNDSALLTPASLTALWSGQNVSVLTGAGGANLQAGMITIQQAIATTTTFNLSIQAFSDLDVTGGGIASNDTGGISLQAGSLLGVNADLTTVGGTISLSAGNSISGDGNIVTKSNDVQGGDIMLTATGGPVDIIGSVSAGDLATSGAAGNVTITAEGTITSSLITAASLGSHGGAVLLQSVSGGISALVFGGLIDVGSFGAAGNAGSITLTAAMDVEAMDLDARSENGHGGAVTLTAGGAPGITLNGMINTGGGVQGGAITLTALTDEVNSGPLVSAGDYVTSGAAGSVTITAAGTVTTSVIMASSIGSHGGAVQLESVNGGISAEAGGLGLIDVGSFGPMGNAGSITLTAATGVAAMDLDARSANGHGGTVTLTAGGAPGITLNGMINTTGALLSGNITLDAPKVSVANITTGMSDIQISSQEVTLGDVHAEGTIHIQPQAGQTAMTLEITGMVTGNAEWFLDFGSSGSFSVAAGATLGGSGTIGGDTTILGTLAPGNSPGTLTFTGDLEIAAAEHFVFELGMPASDRVILTTGFLSIGSLGLDDFTFSEAGGFVPGDYLLFDTNTPITGAFDPGQFSGTVLGYAAELRFTDGGRDITLAVAPEPASATLLVGGLGWLLGRRRPRRTALRRTLVV